MKPWKLLVKKCAFSTLNELNECISSFKCLFTWNFRISISNLSVSTLLTGSIISNPRWRACRTRKTFESIFVLIGKWFFHRWTFLKFTTWDLKMLKVCISFPGDLQKWEHQEKCWKAAAVIDEWWTAWDYAKLFPVSHSNALKRKKSSCCSSLLSVT